MNSMLADRERFLAVAAGQQPDYVPIFGFNSLHPFEVKGGERPVCAARAIPELAMFGWLEKEVVNEGNEHLIEPEELRGKVPPLLAKGRYVPNGDHGLQSRR